MKKKVNLCHVCREKTEGAKLCVNCKKKAKSEANEMRKKVEEALKDGK